MDLQESPDQIDRDPEETAETPEEGTPETQPTTSDENESSEAVESLNDPVDESSSTEAEMEEQDAVPQEKPEPAPAPEPSASSTDPLDAETEEQDAALQEKPEPAPAPEPSASVDDPLDAGGDGETEGPAWYVIHCYSGYENKVRHNLEQRIETMGMKDKIFDVVIPTQEEIEVKDGKRRSVERHIFPGYVLVNMQLTEESWYVVRNTPGVTGFVGMGNTPTALRPEEVAQIIKRMEADAPTVKVTYKVGERVRIIDGPFNDFRGVVSEIDMERTKVRVNVSFFGRETPVELDFLQVEKA
jgi:transcription termination/antitermination protein NusG